MLGTALVTAVQGSMAQIDHVTIRYPIGTERGKAEEEQLIIEEAAELS